MPKRKRTDNGDSGRHNAVQILAEEDMSMSKRVKYGIETLGNMVWKTTATHGAWCGQGWSDNKAQDSVVGYSTAVDRLDQTCKEHDIGIAKGEDRDELDNTFIRANVGKGIKAQIAATAVYAEQKRRHIMGKSPTMRTQNRKDRMITPYRSRTNTVGLGVSPNGEPLGLGYRPPDQVNRAINFDNMQVATLPPQQRATVANTMSGGQGEEVPVMPVPRSISKIHPDYFTVRLPYFFRATFGNASVPHVNANPLCFVRLNSIYDCIKQNNAFYDYKNMPYTARATAALTATAANNVVADAISTGTTAQTGATNPGATDSGGGGPQGRNIWQAHFKYYRVLRSDVKITFVNKNPGSHATDITTSSPFVGTFCVGYELVDEDGQLSNNGEMFMMTKNAERSLLGPAEVGAYVSGNPFITNPSVTSMQHTYVPEAWDYHVEGKGAGETRWTAIGSNPALDHLLAVRCMHLADEFTGSSGGYDKMIGLMIQVEYEVQFMECLDSFYKTQYRPVDTTNT